MSTIYKIFECPNCKNPMSNGINLSVLHFGGKLYSDGIRIAPHIKEFPEITKCKKCNSLFSLSNINYKEESFIIPPSDIDQAELLNLHNYLAILIQNDMNLSKLNSNSELYIRKNIWWGFNDRLRNNEALFQDDKSGFFDEIFEETLWKSNLNRLLEIMPFNTDDQKIAIAEINRNLGNFDECLRLMQSLNIHFAWIKSHFVFECKRENTKLFLLSNEG